MLKDRADKILCDLGLVSSRSQAKSLIENGSVLVNGKVLRKAGEIIEADSKIEITSQLYVGRGALKLEEALAEFSLDVSGQVFLDVGASTGGFTEVLLKAGARKVYAIDVGHDQLAQKLRDDPRVINLEGTNIRDLNELPELADGAVMDLSFISVTKVEESVRKLLKKDANLVVLVKPQFEVGRERLPKDGVVKDPVDQQAALNEVRDFMVNRGWKAIQTIDSPIEGKSGNKEFLSWFIS